jgi:MscS family membrane protein
MLDLTWWQVLSLVGTAAVAVLGGRLLRIWLHRVLYRRVLVARSRFDDRFVLRLEGPAQAIAIVVAWQLLVSFVAYPPSVIAFARAVGHIGLLVALAWGALRMIDVGVELLALRSRWIASHRASQALLPLARRGAQVVLAVTIGGMILAQIGYAVAPLLVLLAIVGAAVALASHRPLENLIAAYAMLGEHGIREGDSVRLDSGVAGKIDVVGLYSTRIRTDEGSYVFVPNRKLADAQIEREVVRPTTAPRAAVSPPSSLSTTSPGGLS